MTRTVGQLYIKPENKEGYSVYPDKEDVNRFFSTLKAGDGQHRQGTDGAGAQVLCTGGGQTRPESGFVRQRYAGD